MVLQRDIPAPIWGWTTPGKEVTVTLNGKSAAAVADADGKWIVKIGPFAAGGPFTLSVQGPESASLEDVLIGDVWIFSGQSNMEMGVHNVNNAKEEIASANFPQIRLFRESWKSAAEPQTHLTGQWQACTPKTIADGHADSWQGFTAIGYFFGRQVHQELNVPIGLVQASWSGTIAQAWVSAEGLKSLPDFAASAEKVKQSGQGGRDTLTAIYNGMIAPLTPAAIKGVVWYQGESNGWQGLQYRSLLSALIKDWRAHFGAGDFTFLIAQIGAKDPVKMPPEPGYAAWAELREAQLLTMQNVPHCGMAVVLDVGAEGLHPKNKQEVGRRLALNALALAYYKKFEFQGPVFKTMEVQGNTIRLKFDHLGGGLEAKGGMLQGFSIAGKDKHFVWADASIDGDSVVVTSPNVAAPLAARYGWAQNPVCNLFNKAGLPASPFRTDWDVKK